MSNNSFFHRFLFIITILVTVGKAQGQTIIEGTITDSLGRAVDAFITISPKGTGNIIGFADTDVNGYYKLQFKSETDSVVVTAAGIGIGNVSRIVANKSQRLDIRANQKEIELKEVSVKADKIRQNGDTLNYFVGTYQQQGDRVIGDVLKRMPGIEVSENGGIKYNGKAIKKFYVEEMDLLQGRYGIATNNINAQDVATVQVLENHQPVKMLQGKTLTDDVAINLKLKNSAKGTIAINTMLGGGAQQAQTLGSNPLWTAEAVGMYFAKRRQNMTLYKGNNTGEDISKELTQHYSSINSVGLYPFCPTNVIQPSGSGLPQKRTFNNHSHIVTLNHLEKLNKDTETGINIAYHNDCIRREGNSLSDIFINDDSRLLTREILTSETKINNLNVQARYNWNAENGFMANVLKFDTNWNSDHVDGLMASEQMGFVPVNYGNERVRQHFRRPELSISNTFNTIRNIGKNTFDLHFSAGYAHRPNTLNVAIDSLDSQSIIHNSQSYQQDINSHHIAACFNTSYEFRLGDHFRFNYGINASANLHGIVTDLDGATNFQLSTFNSQLTNDLWYNTYNIALWQSYKYNTHDLDITLALPLELYTQTLDDRIRKDKNSYTHLLFFPSL